MLTSPSINELAAALAKAQAKIKSAPKDNVASVKSDKGNYQYHYSTLADVWEACREALSANGLAVVQLPAADGNKVTISTLLAHTSGQWVSGELTLVARDASPQAIGSCITYGRRYAIGSMVGVVSEEDDDGQAAQPKPPIKSNGNGSARPPAGPSPEEQEADRLEKVCAAGFETEIAKLQWKAAYRDIINSLPKDRKQSVVAAFEKAAVRGA